MNNLIDFIWINKPNNFEITDTTLKIITDPGSDFWQRTYYGFQNDNAHAFVLPVMDDQFSYTVKSKFQPNKLFDQCGIVVYQNSDNWVKASVEFDNEEFSRLGSVVTNLGYSDWASVDVDPKLTIMYYRLSRRGQDFLIEYSENGETYKQMRILHLHEKIESANIGVYACSPLESSIKAEFSQFNLGDCVWEAFEESQ